MKYGGLIGSQGCAVSEVVMPEGFGLKAVSEQKYTLKQLLDLLLYLLVGPVILAEKLLYNKAVFVYQKRGRHRKHLVPFDYIAVFIVEYPEVKAVLACIVPYVALGAIS